MEYTTNKFGAIIPKRATQSYLNFAHEIQHSELFLMMFAIGGGFIHDNQGDVIETLIDLYEDPKSEEADKLIDFLKSNKGNDIIDIKTYEQFYGQMCYARTIDNVLTYFKEILSEVIIKNPNTLKSKETEKLDFILKFDSMNDLRVALSEKKIESLFYSGIDKIEAFFGDRLGIKLFKAEEDKKEFNQAVKNRNIIVHNRGKVNKEYLKDFPDTSFKLGDYLKYSYEDISRINILLLNFIAFLDYEIAQKFQLLLKDFE